MFKHLLLSFFILSLITFGLCAPTTLIENDGSKNVKAADLDPDALDPASPVKAKCSTISDPSYYKITSQIQKGASQSYVDYLIPVKGVSAPASACDVLGKSQTETTATRSYTYSKIDPMDTAFDGTSITVPVDASIGNYLGGSLVATFLDSPRKQLPFWGDDKTATNLGGCCKDGSAPTDPASWGIDYKIEAIAYDPKFLYLNKAMLSDDSPFIITVGVTDIYGGAPDATKDGTCAWAYVEKGTTGTPTDITPTTKATSCTLKGVNVPGFTAGKVYTVTLTFTAVSGGTKQMKNADNKFDVAPGAAPAPTMPPSPKPSSFHSYKISCVLMAIIAIFIHFN